MSTTDQDDFAALAPGRKVGRYEIVAILGQGGFGITYRAHDTQLDRDVALKEYLPSALAVRHGGVTVVPRSTKMMDDFAWGRQRFVDEGRTLATLQRAPAIVRVFDFLEANGTAYIVMELVPGQTLESRLRHGDRMIPAEIESILWPLLDGMERVHATGFLHRDIKPANILLSDEGRPTLIDFGASRVAVAGRTAAMTAIFTPGYAAAEQFTSARQGPWTDIYGISATIYHAITGAAPPSAFDRMLSDSYRRLADLAPAGFSPELLAGVDNALSVRASERPQTIAEWRAILQGKVLPAGPVAEPPPAAVSKPVAPPPTHARRGLWVGIAAAAVLLVAGGGYYFLPRPSAPPAVAAAEKKVDAEVSKIEQEVERLRAEKAAREKADQQAAHEADLRKQIEADERRQFEAEQAEKEKKRQEEEARQKAEAEQKQRELAAGTVPSHAPYAPDPYDGSWTGAAVFTANRLPTSTTITSGKGTGTWPVRRCSATATLSYVLTIDASGNAKLDMQGFDRQCTPTSSSFTGHVDNNRLAISWGNEGAHLELTRTGPDPAQAQAEAGEGALHLSLLDRQHLQVALTSLGYDTNGHDGMFGPHTRGMVAAWQKARNDRPTGFFTGGQSQALQKEAAAAIAKFDEASTSTAGITGFDGTYSGKAIFPSINGHEAPTAVRVTGGKGTSSWPVTRCGLTAVPYTLTIDASGTATLSFQGFDQQCTFKPFVGTARIENNSLDFHWGALGSHLVLTRKAN